MYGAVNGYTTETYESLHKDFVKTPYRMSNKKNVETQLLQNIRRQAISYINSQRSVIKRTPRPYNFSKKFFKFSLRDSNEIFNEKKEMPGINNNMKTGFDNFSYCLELYLELLKYPSIDGSQVNIYESVTLENGSIVCTTNNYHNKAWFSNVSVSMNPEELDDYTSDQGVCYGLVTFKIF